MEETNLAAPSDLSTLVQSNQKATAGEDFKSIVTAAEYLPRIALCGSSSDLCKEGKIGVGNYALIKSKESFIDLGPEFDSYLLGMRPLALDISDDSNIISSFDPKSETFKSIQSESEGMNGKVFGPQFLHYIPKIDQFGLFHCNSKTSRRESNNIYKLIGQPITLKSHLIDNGKHKWHGPQVFTCSNPLPVPPLDKVEEQLKKFNNPDTTNQAEKAPVSGAERAR